MCITHVHHRRCARRKGEDWYDQQMGDARAAEDRPHRVSVADRGGSSIHGGGVRLRARRARWSPPRKADRRRALRHSTGAEPFSPSRASAACFDAFLRPSTNMHASWRSTSWRSDRAGRRHGAARISPRRAAGLLAISLWPVGQLRRRPCRCSSRGWWCTTRSTPGAVRCSTKRIIGRHHRDGRVDARACRQFPPPGHDRLRRPGGTGRPHGARLCHRPRLAHAMTLHRDGTQQLCGVTCGIYDRTIVLPPGRSTAYSPRLDGRDSLRRNDYGNALSSLNTMATEPRSAGSHRTIPPAAVIHDSRPRRSSRARTCTPPTVVLLADLGGDDDSLPEANGASDRSRFRVGEALARRIHGLAGGLAGGSGWVLLTYVPRDRPADQPQRHRYGQNIAGGIRSGTRHVRAPLPPGIRRECQLPTSLPFMRNIDSDTAHMRYRNAEKVAPPPKPDRTVPDCRRSRSRRSGRCSTREAGADHRHSAPTLHRAGAWI